MNNLIRKSKTSNLNNKEQFIDKDFLAYNDLSYGKCYRFNSGKNNNTEIIPIKKSKKSGWYDGFHLSFYSNTTLDYGRFIISIHNHTQTTSNIFNKGYLFIKIVLSAMMNGLNFSMIL